MKCKIQEEIFNETKNLTPAEEHEYYRMAIENGPFAEKIARIRKKQEKRRDRDAAPKARIIPTSQRSI